MTFISKILSICALTVVTLLTACSTSGSSYMNTLSQEEAQQQLVVNSNESVVIFFRPSFLGNAISAVVIDGKFEYKPVGVSRYNTRMIYRTTPGKHTFAVMSEGSANFLEAELEGGKIYFATVEPFMGMWKARFDFIAPDATHRQNPVPELIKLLKDTEHWTMLNQQGIAWFKATDGSIKEKVKEGLIDQADRSEPKDIYITPNMGVTKLPSF